MTDSSFNLVSIKHKGCPLCALEAKDCEEGTFEFPEVVYSSIDLQSFGEHHAGICKKHGIFSADEPEKLTPEQKVNMSDPHIPDEHKVRVSKFISYFLSTGFIGLVAAKDKTTQEYRSVIGYSDPTDPDNFIVLGHLTPGNDEDLKNQYEFFH